MDITHTQFKRCDLLKVEGRVDSSTAPYLGDNLEAIFKEGRYRIVLDLGKVDFMSSAGMRTLINAQKNCKRYNRGELVLASVPANVFSALDLAGFTALFKIFDDVTTGVGNF